MHIPARFRTRVVGFVVLICASVALFAATSADAARMPTCTLTSNVSTINWGQSATLSWTSKFASSATLSTVGAITNYSKGSRVVSPTVTTTYVFTASNSTGSNSCSRTITVIPPPAPTCTLSASRSTVEVGDWSDLSWVTTNATSGAINSGVGAMTPIASSSREVMPTAPTTYTATVSGNGGSVTCNTSVAVVPAPVDKVRLVPRLISTTTTVTGGAAYRATAGTAFGAGSVAGPYALEASAPATSTGSTTITFSTLNANASRAWWLTTAVGLKAGAPAGTKVKLLVIAEADRVDPSDALSEVLYSAELTAGSTTPLSIPLGVWTQRSNVKVSLVLQKVGTTTSPAVLDDLHIYQGNPLPELSINRANLVWATTTQQQQVVAAMAGFDFAWFRDGIRASSTALVSANLRKQLQDQGKRNLLLISLDASDFDAGSAARRYVGNQTFKSLCGFDGANPVSEVNLDRFEARLRAHLQAYKNAGVSIEAVEVGNEYDLVCFNGDIPLDRSVLDDELPFHAEAYARLLERTEAVVHEPQYYPESLILSYGIAHFRQRTENTFPAIKSPGKLLGILANLNGKNYLSLLDGLGIHIYPPTDGIVTYITTNLSRYMIDTGTNLPVWVTEWGYRNSQFPTTSGMDRYRAFVNFYDSVLRQPTNFQIANLMHYSFDDFGNKTLVDTNYQPLPEARFFDHY